MALVLLLAAPLRATGEEAARSGTVRQALDASIARGVDFLLARQNPNGSWGSARQTKGLNIFAPVPGAHHAFRAAVTSLCVSALTEVGADDARVGSALDRAERWMLRELGKVRRATPDALYNVWGHAYAIQALVRLRRRAANDEERQRLLGDLLRGQIERLQRYELVDGGWGYYDFDFRTQKPGGSPTCFTTATVLVAFAEARDDGFKVPPRLVSRALASIRRQAKPDFTYIYGEYLRWRPMRGINRAGGSLGRSQACNLARRVWGDSQITDALLGSWLRRLLDRNLWLDMGRKRPIPHESWFQVAGYFFYYGHYYAALCLELVDPQQHRDVTRRLADVILRLQEKDGSWWDFPFYDYHQQYGTAFAVMTLARCRAALSR